MHAGMWEVRHYSNSDLLMKKMMQVDAASAKNIGGAQLEISAKNNDFSGCHILFCVNSQQSYRFQIETENR